MSYLPTVLQQIEEELGEHAQTSLRVRPVLRARFERDLESEAYTLLLTEEEREQIRAILSSLTKQ
jgi:hypothetical protein